MTHDCPSCGDVFDSQRGMKIHHKIKHGESIAGVEVTCENCGTQFRRTESRVERADQSFCSVECQDQGRVGEFAGENNPSWEGKTKQITCDQCGEEFPRYKSRIDPAKNFCSRECQTAWRSHALSGERNPNWKPKNEFECDHCGDVVKKYPKESEYRHHFCDKECYKSWQSNDGSRSAKWRVKHGGYWKKQREKAIKRDNKECQKCGMSQREHRAKFAISLHVHHKKPARLFGSAKNAHKIDNLVTLCAQCHVKVESENEKKHEQNGRQPTLLGAINS